MYDEHQVLAELRGMGARFDPDVLMATRALFRSAAQAVPWAHRTAVYDLVYGPEERHRLDVYPTDQSGAPVILFLHGGGFIGGDKRGDPIFYGNVGRYFAEHGFLAVLANYQLAPAAVWPSGNEDVARMADWVHRYAGEYGGDGERLVMIGQSAGAAHIAGYLFAGRPDLRCTGTIRAAALMSGFYRAQTPLLGGPKQYFGEDESLYSDRSPATHVNVAHPPLLLSVAELDPAPIARQTLDFASALTSADGSAPRLLWCEGHNHVSTVHGLGLGRDSVGQVLRDFACKYT